MLSEPPEQRGSVTNELRVSRLEHTRGWVHTHGATLVDLFRTADAALILWTLWLSELLLGSPWRDAHLLLGLAAVALFTTTAGQWTLYRSWRVNKLHEELIQVSVCWFAAVLVLIAGLYFLEPVTDLAHSVILLWLTLSLGGMLAGRLFIRSFLRLLRGHGANYRLAAIIGANETANRIASEILSQNWMGLKLIGIFDDRNITESPRSNPAHFAGSTSQLLAEVAVGHVDIVYITLPLRAEFRIFDLVQRMRDSTVTVMYVPDFSTLGLLHSRWEVMAGLPMVSLVDTPHQGVAAIGKRVFDLVVGTFILLLVALPMLLIALSIRVSSPGPVLFRQKRYGLDGREIVIYKFRTMNVVEDGRSQFTQASRGDSRVTRLGAFLRRTSLDELPQFINVLQGRMSIVGPRPHPVALNESHRRLINGYMLRHKVRPGITGWAQVNGFRGETDTPEKMLGRIRHDLEYIDRWSLWLDVRIILLTLVRGFVDKNAY